MTSNGIAVSKDLLQLLKRPDMREYADRLANVESGFYSKPELGHRVAGTDKVGRRAFYVLADALANSGIMPSFDAVHNAWVLVIYRVDAERLAEFFGALQ